MQAVRNFTDSQGVKRMAGEFYLFKGPATYFPRIEETIVQEVVSTVISKGQALKLRAKQDLADQMGIERKTGEEWLVRQAGLYLPECYEEIINLLDPVILTE